LLKTADIQLVPIEVDHLDEIMKNFNDPELRRFLGGFIPYSRLQEEEWIESMQMEMKKRSNFTFAIERLPKKQFIGTAALHNIDWLSRSCTFGIAIHAAENWGKGFGTQAIELALEFAWKSLNLRRIELSVHEYNERAKHVYEKLGFVEYGKAHQKYFIDGKYVNTYYMELLRDTEKQFMKICDK
jgi:RimJ/RimL family protein N-acetyltransferase